jgi:signal peptidase II
MRRSNTLAFWAVVATVTVCDVLTKWWAVRDLSPHFMPRGSADQWLRLTLVYNPGAAFGLHVGDYSRWVFMGLTVIALAILGRLYLSTRDGDMPRAIALALVCGGALGNLIDRVRSDQGVVDFIDIGFGTMRWPTFNIADVAVSSGAVLLAWVLWYADQQQEGAAAIATAPVPAENGELS